jgi:eukaryotic-like serine/threonine-protein kinase
MAGTEVYMDLFRKEGVALAKLRHPGIVPIYDIRERGGLIYYIMPFVAGTTLDRRLHQSRLPPLESRRILSEICDALSAAHNAKMVHLDIKPENVFLEGDLQNPLLLDFGVAVPVTEMVPESGGPIAGTPSYMSPEQARGQADIDHRSDIYSLGALAYRMIMGRPPYMARTVEQVVKLHAAGPPVHIRDINPSIPKDFADAIMKCLEKDPWKRFATVKELGGVLQNVTFSTQRDTSSHEVPTAGARAPLVILIASLALLAGIILGQLIG